MQTELVKKLEKIKFAFSVIIANISLSNKTNQTDINNYIVEFFIPFLNSFLKCTLKDANHEKQNFPAIDLIDKNKRIAVQVTSSDTAEKEEEYF